MFKRRKSKIVKNIGVSHRIGIEVSQLTQCINRTIILKVVAVVV